MVEKRKLDEDQEIIQNNPLDEVIQLYISHVINNIKNNDPKLLNGVINYCNDFMIARDNQSKKQKNNFSSEYKYFGSLNAVYALSLSKLSFFINQQDDESDIDYEKMFKNILDAYDNSFEFINLGQKFSKDESSINYKLLNFVNASINLQKIANYFIGKEMVSYYEFDEHIKDEINKKDILNIFKVNWDIIHQSLNTLIDESKNYISSEICIAEFIAVIIPDVLQTMHVIIDSNETIGSDSKEKILDEGIDEDHEFTVVKELPSTHPLQSLHSEIIENQSDYVVQLRNMFISCNQFLEEFSNEIPDEGNVEDNDDNIEKLTKQNILPLRLEILRSIGDYFLKELDNPHTSERDTQSLLKQNGVYMSKLYQLSESPDDWVIYSESLIQLSALNEDNKKVQDKLLKKAMKLLQKANRVSNGKYDDFIESLEEDLAE
ncbi:uncharacterized protein HGUI_03759 [Hanseniaspora guilliermondii]|uniref:Enhancer of translation termination 1 n=1 Tax=Hanseniaspora guilliermondii TaxID=56406 RepID=A0A1L0FPQ1_9ASCO|nr:uncharacterized protein HGUI_03759 [Hanseniaspora guilliermondii]